MDPTRFDALARSLAAPQSRRGLLGGAAALLAGLAAGRAAAAAPAGKVGVCHQTGSASNRYEYIEVSQNVAETHAAHGDAVGVNLRTDLNNCGTCGTVCGGDACNTAVCQGGKCTTTAVVCPDDGNVCTDVSCVAGTGCVPTNNTAACMTTDGEPGTCAGGFCVCTPQSNTQTCTSQGRVCGPATNNCGGPVASCGACAANETCTQAGTCACPNVSCGAACCPPNQICIGGACAVRAGVGLACDTSGDNDCQEGLTCCGGFCRDTLTDENNCGGCADADGDVCQAGDPNLCQGAGVCTTGVCGFTPLSDGAACDDGLFCTTGDTCQAGACAGGTPTCDPNACLTCDETANTCTSACTANQTCTQGMCTCPNVTCNGACCAPGQVCGGSVCAAPTTTTSTTTTTTTTTRAPTTTTTTTRDPRGTCTTGPTCNGGNNATCNNRSDCYCWTSATGGAIVCAAGGNCSGCTSDASCVAEGYPQGSRCVLVPSCGCPSGRACQAPCPA